MVNSSTLSRTSMLRACLLSSCFLACAATAVRAAEPMAIVSISSVQGLIDDVTHISKLAGAEDAGKFAVMMARSFTVGIDGKRPVGMVVDSQFRPLMFVPVENLELTLEALKDQIGEPQDAGDGVLEIAVGPTPVFVKESNGWAFMSQSVDGLGKLPQDPVSMLGKLPKQYDIAIRGFVQRVPAEYRDMALTQMKAGAEQGLQRQPDESDENYEARRAMMENQLKQMSMIFNETDQLTLGIKIDQEDKTSYLDMLISAKADSKMASQFASMKNAKTHFAPLLKGEAALKMVMANEVPAAQADEAAQQLEVVKRMVLNEIDKSTEIPDADTRRVARQVVGDMLETVTATIKSGRMDMAAAVDLGGEAASFAAAVHVADSRKFEEAIKSVIDLAKKDPEAPQVKMNAETHGGVRFHKLDLPIGDGKEDARKLFGNSLQIALGIDKEAVYISIGEGGLTKIKALIDNASDKPTELKRPFAISASLTQILHFLETMDDNPALAAISEIADESQGSDQIRLFVQPIPNGAGYRLQVGEGVIKILGKAIQAAQGAASGV